MIEMKECKYRLPCNWCDKFNKYCDMTKPIKIELPDQNKCDHHWKLEGSYVDSESGEWKHKYICNKCHEIRMIHKETELYE